MNYHVPGRGESETIDITVEIDSNGDAELKAQGVTVLWLTRTGYLLRNEEDNKSLKQLGFDMGEKGICMMVSKKGIRMLDWA